MRALGWVGVLVALVIVGVLVKKQMSGMAANTGASGAPTTVSQPRQVQQQFQQSLDAAMQQPRPVPDEAR